MKTLLEWPRPRDPHAHEPTEVIWWSVFPDVVGVWNLEDSLLDADVERAAQ